MQDWVYVNPVPTSELETVAKCLVQWSNFAPLQGKLCQDPGSCASNFLLQFQTLVTRTFQTNSPTGGSPCRRQPHPGPRQALPRPVRPLPQRDPDAVEVGRREDADPVADDPVGKSDSRRGLGGHPTVPLRSPPRQTPAHRGVLGTRLTLIVQKGCFNSDALLFLVVVELQRRRVSVSVFFNFLLSKSPRNRPPLLVSENHNKLVFFQK